MRRVAGSGASTAAESSSLQRTRGTSAGRNSVYPPVWGHHFLIISSASRLKSLISETGRLHGVRRDGDGCCAVLVSTRGNSRVPEMDAGTLVSDNLLPHKRLASVSCERLGNEAAKSDLCAVLSKVP